MTTLQTTAITMDPESAFDRDKFLLRQKLVAINQKYFVSDEDGREILFVERRTHLLRSIAAIFAGLLVAIVGVILIALLIESLPNNSSLAPVVGVGLGLLTLAVLVGVVVLIHPKRHVRFYLDKSRQHLVLSVVQHSKWELITATYTVMGRDGQALAQLRKNYLWNFLRRRWRVLDTGGEFIALAIEDSMLRSILRRTLGQYGLMIVTNFIINTPDGRRLGTFNRKFTIRDKYVLDLTPDEDVELDRRVALALGVMLDTGERR